MEELTQKFRPGKRHLLFLALTVVAVYAFLPQLGGFRSSWHLLSRPDLGYTAAAVLLTFMSYVAASGTYYFLAFRPLRLWRTVITQLAAMFVNRLLPAGLGALGANYLYLRKEKHSASQAATAVGVNNLLGFLGHGLIVSVAFAFMNSPAKISVTYSEHLGLPVKIAGLLLLAGLVAYLIFGHRKFLKSLTDIKRQLLDYRHRPFSALAALATSMTLTLCNVLSLLCCLHALGLSLPFTAVLLVFTFGVGAGAAVPTPGGIGGFEAGLAAGFVAYGIGAAPALASALLYRLVSYWLPLLVGAVALVAAQRRHYFSG